MKKFYLLLLALIVGIGAVNAKRVYFQNTGNWGTIYVHHWTDGGDETKWPGDVLNKENNVVINGTTYYYFETERAKIIFNNNSGSQTKDLQANDGAVYSMAKNANSGSGMTTDPIGTITQNSDGSYRFTKAGEVVLVEGHLYFAVQEPYTKDKNVYLHTWSPQITSNGYPGDQLTISKL